MKQKKYKYLHANGLICRYLYLPKKDCYERIGQIYDQKEKRWITSKETMRIEESGNLSWMSEAEVNDALADQNWYKKKLVW